MIDNPFARVPSDVDSIVQLVKRGAKEECAPGACLVYPALDACARDAVEAYWDSRIKTFVPLLALRRVRACIRAGTCELAECERS
jgi:hypothetical protein